MKHIILRPFILGIGLALAACGNSDGNPLSPAQASHTIAEQISTEYQAIRLVSIVEGLNNPWAIAFLPDGRLLVSERSGQLSLIENGNITRISGVPADMVAINQGGLMDIALHPDYASNGWLYLTYSQGDNQATAATLIRARLEGNALVDVEQIFTQDRRSDPGRHYGSRLAFLPDNTLLMSIGDRGVKPERAQDLGDHAGKLLRLNDDGRIPEDNPFVGRDDVLPEIFSYGHRNIQGLIVHPDSGAIWATEHGPRGGDELNLVEAGNNYGWPTVTLGRDYATEGRFGGNALRSKPGMVDPVIDWTPALAASGLAYVNGDRFNNWQGNLLAGGLRAEHIRRVAFDDGEAVHEEELIRGEIGRIRDVRVGPDGMIYIATGESEGGIYRIEPAN